MHLRPSCQCRIFFDFLKIIPSKTRNLKLTALGSNQHRLVSELQANNILLTQGNKQPAEILATTYIVVHTTTYVSRIPFVWFVDTFRQTDTLKTIPVSSVYDCLEKYEYYQNCSVLCCVPQLCTIIQQYLRVNYGQVVCLRFVFVYF